MDQTVEDVIADVVSHRLIVPAGWRCIFIAAAWMKALVEREAMQDCERLELLEAINRLAEEPVPMDRGALALIPALDDTSMEIVAEARKLDPPDGGFDKSDDLLASDDVFATVLRLNPGIAAAIVSAAGLTCRAAIWWAVERSQPATLIRWPSPPQGQLGALRFYLTR